MAKRPNPPPHTARIALSGTFQTARWANIFWVRNYNAVTPDESSLEALLKLVGDSFDAHFMDSLSSQLHLNDGNLLYWDAVEAIAGAEWTFTHVGGLTSPPSPANCAIGVSWKVVPHYRGGHYRTYLCGVDSGDLTDTTTIGEAPRAAIEAAANAFMRDVNAFTHGEFGNARLGAPSFVKDGAYRTNSVWRDYIVDAAQVDNRIDTQRRRLGPDR